MLVTDDVHTCLPCVFLCPKLLHFSTPPNSIPLPCFLGHQNHVFFRKTSELICFFKENFNITPLFPFSLLNQLTSLPAKFCITLSFHLAMGYLSQHLLLEHHSKRKWATENTEDFCTERLTHAKKAVYLAVICGACI